MALATHQLQGSCGTFHSVSYPSLWSRGGKVKYSSPSFLAAGRRDRLITLKCRSQSRTPLVLGSKPKPFKISAFKGGSRHDDSGDRANSSKSVKNPVKVTYFQHEGEKSSAESSKVHNAVPSPFSVPDETRTRSLAIQNLFRKWLVVLRTPLESQPMERAIEEPSSVETSEVPKPIQKEEKGQVMKAIWCSLVGLDATIIIPLLIFTPMFLGVNLVYGSEVSKELTPLWIVGPFIVALYVRMFRAICNLYVFSFWLTIKVVRNLPVYYMLVYEYLIGGKLKEAIQMRLWQPLLDIKNMDYKEVTMKNMKDLQEWLVEKYLDFVESIWPYYCRTIRFLKRANLIENCVFSFCKPAKDLKQ